MKIFTPYEITMLFLALKDYDNNNYMTMTEQQQNIINGLLTYVISEMSTED